MNFRAPSPLSPEDGAVLVNDNGTASVVRLDANGLGDLKMRLVKPVMAKLIKKIKKLRTQNKSIVAQNKSLEKSIQECSDLPQFLREPSAFRPVLRGEC